MIEGEFGFAEQTSAASGDTTRKPGTGEFPWRFSQVKNCFRIGKPRKSIEKNAMHDISYWIKEGDPNPHDQIELSEFSQHNAATLVLYQSLRQLEYSRFCKTRYWRTVTEQIIQRADYRCQLCDRSGSLVAHHRGYRNHGREHLNMIDLVALCSGCHHHHHFVKGRNEVVYEHEQKEEAAEAVPKGYVRITKQIMDDLRTNGSYTTATLDALGLEQGKLAAGWGRRMIGKIISQADYDKAKAGVGLYANQYRAMKRK